ncbi:MAG TPA: antitoxin Xre-like helix-turn-helix domain-containing protein [Bryobacteraceae bacterium]|jgi:putative toxin-antitoxin system antitoxin component (TIGR02293 family)|nr:antitoxin Xre-like helix-turn-helix domain-containing protein [Bryobacteraceae bacterium]
MAEMSVLNLVDYVGVSAPSELDLAGMIEQGLPLESVNRLREKGLTFSEVADVVISPRTLKHRKARGEQLSNEEADRVVRVARIVALAEQVFHNHDKGLAWLRTPDDRVQGRTPLSLLHTESGGRAVENMLWQIDDGVYA